MKRSLIVLLILLIHAAPLRAQSGDPEMLDLTAWEVFPGTWSRTAWGGEAPGPRYAVYLHAQRPSMRLYWRPLRGSRSQGTADEWAAALVAGTHEGLSGEAPVAEVHNSHPYREYGIGASGDAPSGHVRVWECPESGRDFAVLWQHPPQTPKAAPWLAVMSAMAGTVACHGPVRQAPRLTVPLVEVALYRDLALGFRVPQRWRWDERLPGSTSLEGGVGAEPREQVGWLIMQRGLGTELPLVDFLAAGLSAIPVLLEGPGRSVQVLPGPIVEVSGSRYSEGILRIADARTPWLAGEYRFAGQTFTASGAQHLVLVAWRVTLEGPDPGLPWTRIRDWLDRAKRAYRP